MAVVEIAANERYVPMLSICDCLSTDLHLKPVHLNVQCKWFPLGGVSRLCGIYVVTLLVLTSAEAFEN